MVPAFVIVVFFLLSTLAKSAASNVTGCISDYNEFKNLTLNQGVYGTRNRLQLFEVFYRPNLRLPFSVFVFYETVLPNSTTENIITGKCAGRTAWAWISSPLFLVVRAEFLNPLSLYTLNHFNRFTTVTVAITVPRPCKTEQLLAMFTSEVSQNHRHAHRYTHIHDVRTCISIIVRVILLKQSAYNNIRLSTFWIHIILHDCIL